MTSSERLENLLDEDAAAIKLGITKELLYAYARYAPKKHLGHERKLIAVRQGNLYFFKEQDLEEWDAYLHEPWSESGAARPTIPSYIEDYLKVEAGSQCALCGTGHKLENAHIIAYTDSHSHHHHNLVRLCKDCHTKFDEKIILLEEIQQLKKRLIEKVREIVRSGKQYFGQASTAQTLPQPKPLFVGRDTELENLKNALAEERAVVIEGIGGIGKTQLALQALSAEDTKAIWVDVESARTFAELQTMFGTTLLREGILADSEKSVFEVLDRKSIRVVFDGIDRLPPPEQEKLIDFLQNFLKFTRTPTILITTQIEFHDLEIRARKIKLSSLSPADSRLLIFLETENLEDVVINESDVGWLADFCEGHPLSLQIVGGLAAYYKKSKTVVQRLAARGAGEMKNPVRREQKRSTSLQVCLEAAYSCFNDVQKWLLFYLSNFPAGCLEIKAEHWYGDEWKKDENDFDMDLAELRRFFFIEAQQDQMYITLRLHLLNPVGQFIRKQWKDTNAEQAAKIQTEAAEQCMMEAAVIRFDCLESADFEAVQIGLLRIDCEFPNYVAAMNYAERESRRAAEQSEDATSFLQITARLASSLSKYFFVRGVFHFGSQFLETGIAAREALGQYDSAASDYVMLASLQYRMFDYDAHRRTTQKLAAHADRTGNPRIKALASLCSGEVADKRGENDAAVAHFEAAANYFQEALQRKSEVLEIKSEEESADYFVGMLGITFASLGRAYEHSNRPAQALDYFQKALEYALKVNDYANVGSDYHEIGNCHSLLGRPAKAVAAYKKAAEYFYQLGYRQFISNALGELGESIVDAGIDAETEEFLSEDLLRVGLEDIESEVALLAARSDRPVGDDILMLRKLFGIIKLVSFSKNAGNLQEWTKDFGRQIIAPLLAEEYDESNLQEKSFRHFLNLIASLSYNLGDIIHKGEEFNESYIFRLCILCDLINELPSFRPFDFFAALLRHRKVRPSITGSLLEEMTQCAVENKNEAEFELF